MSETFNNWLEIPRDVFAPPTADSRLEHLAVLSLFHEAVFEPALNLEALAGRLRSRVPELAADDAHLTRVLTQLCRWGLLEESRDDSVAYSDPAEFQRRHLQWSLTHQGQATIAALDAAFEQLRSAAALQPAAIDAIAAALSDVADWLDGTDGHVDEAIAGTVHIRLFQAEAHHRSLIENLRTFTRQVTLALSRPDIDDSDLAEAKSHIVSYLDRYVVGTDLPARRVAAALERIDDLGFDFVAGVAARGENLAPTLDGVDPTPAAARVRREHLDALSLWFATGERVPLFADLLPRGRDAVLRFLRILGIRREVNRRDASLPEDFRALARLFNAVNSDNDAHRLWGAATGLTPSRHHHLRADDADRTPSRGNPAALNPPAELVIELRRNARSTGRPPHARPVADRTSSRAAAQALRAAEIALARARREELVTNGVVRLASFAELDPDVFEVFVEMIAAALAAARDESGHRSARSTDGHVLVEIGPVDAHASTHTAHVRTATGTLSAPDLTVAVEVLGRPVTQNTATQGGVA